MTVWWRDVIFALSVPVAHMSAARKTIRPDGKQYFPWTIRQCDASCKAESPPPITPTVWSLYNGPSQLAQWLTPRPISFSSPGTPRCLSVEPVATITALARYFSSSVNTDQIFFLRFEAHDFGALKLGAVVRRLALQIRANFIASIPSGKPGIFDLLDTDQMSARNIGFMTNVDSPWRAENNPAVKPARPEPIIITS